MPVDRHYLLFVHGVNVRERRELPTYADYLFDLITNKVRAAVPDAELRKVPFYWGDVGEADENEMLDEVKSSPIYQHFYMRDIRETQIQQFLGDAALYISRTCGAKVLERIRQQAETHFKDFNPEDRNHVHLITHSWGTVILLDALFADRWDDVSAPAYAVVQEIRRIMFGVKPEGNSGLFVRSIHTMGSPLAMFSLLEKVDPVQAVAVNAVISPAKLAQTAIGGRERATVAAGINPAPAPVLVDGKTHDITDHLTQFLDALYAELNVPLPWNNYAHPGDLVAYPLSVLLPKMLTGSNDRISVTDFLVQDAGPHWFENVDPLALIRAGEAHGSYWHSNSVAEEITRAIVSVK